MSATELTNWRTKQIVDPVAEDYYQRLAQADQIIFIFPIWWEVMPTMTKGFLDKVLSKSHYQSSRPPISYLRNPELLPLLSLVPPHFPL